jgi:hypothetical protein
VPGLMLAAVNPDNTPHGYNWTFAFPMLLFIVVAAILYTLFSRPHRRVPAGRISATHARSPDAAPASSSAASSGASSAASSATSVAASGAPDSRGDDTGNQDQAGPADDAEAKDADANGAEAGEARE